MLSILNVSDEDGLKKFVTLPYRLYKDDPLWATPMLDDELQMLRKESNPAYKFCDVGLWIAERDGIVVGRIGAIINHKWIEKNGRKCGRLTRFECEENSETARLLIQTAEKWLVGHGMDIVHGPLGFSNLDHQGLLIAGFNHRPSAASDYGKSYYQSFFHNNGYVKEIDWLEFRLTIPNELPPKAQRVARIVENRTGIKARSLRDKKELKQYAPKIFNLFNEAFAQLFGTYEFSEEMKKFYINKFLPIIDAKYVVVAEDENNNLVAFIIAMPGLAEALNKAKGNLWPFGWWHIMKAYRNPKEIDLLLTGIKPEIQRQGIAALLMERLWQICKINNIAFAETTSMLENNHVAIQMWKSFDHIQHKRKRCFMKILNGKDPNKQI